MNEDRKKVPKRIAQTILNSLKGGVVPRIGLPYIAVGRKNEIEALLHDVDIIAEGGASFRFIVGRYGSGKSFLLQTIRNYVMDRGFIVADADLSPERRLQGTRGQGLATYRELIGNLSTKTKPEGGALSLVLDRWISGVQAEAVQETGLQPGDPALTKAVDQKIYANIVCSDKEIGVYPADESAHYKWSYVESPDMELGTEGAFTYTSDNKASGKRLCVTVTVDGYSGQLYWEQPEVVNPVWPENSDVSIVV